MKKIYVTLGMMLMLVSTLCAQQSVLHDNDLNAPFGWATCSSMTSGDDYKVTGGGNTTPYVLKSTGKDMTSTIKNALKKYSVVVFDGSEGDFLVSSTIELSSLKNRTIVGINGARLCTSFFFSEEIHKALDKANVKSASTASGTGGNLSNGTSVGEARELLTRQTLIDLLGDSSEPWRKAGIFSVKRCDNIIIRNLQFVGPGACDVGGSDLISSTYTTHLWVDHCSFTDGEDGNFDITNESNFVTVSWCVFNYTDHSYDHANTTLIGSSDSNTADENKLNVTLANIIWGEGCMARMPMARFGTIHVLNNYFNCAGNGSAVNPRKNSEVLIEGNYFEKGVKKIFSQSGAKAYQFVDNHYSESFSQPGNKGTVSIPYSYIAASSASVPAMLTGSNGAGATLTDPLTIGRESTGIEQAETSSKLLKVNYLSLEGVSQFTPHRGINIVVEHYTDGSTKVSKQFFQ